MPKDYHQEHAVSLYFTNVSRTIGRFKYRKLEREERQIGLKVTLKNLSVFKVLYSTASFRIRFEQGFHSINPQAINGGTSLSSDVSSEKDCLLIKIGIEDKRSNDGRDFIKVKCDNKTLDELNQACRRRDELVELCINDTDFRFCCGNKKTFTGTITSYRFGNLDQNECVPTQVFPDKGPMSLIEINLKPSEKEIMIATQNPKFHVVPHPHLLDFDWRFTSQTCRLIINFCRQNTAKGERICYLGCPTLALWHRQLFPDEKNWHLLDHGHYGLTKWRQQGLIPSESFLQYDVFDALPSSLRGRFAVVVTDPPWYFPYYRIFCKRTKELVKAGGIIGLTHYPPFDTHKYEEFQKVKSSNVPYELQEFGAMEIDYEVPEFERATNLYKHYEHPSLGIYRPGYIDFFAAPSREFSVESTPEPPEVTFLPNIHALPEGHHLRYCLKEVLEKVFQGQKVRARKRESIARIKEPEKEKLIAWSTENTIVELSEDGAAIQNLEELVSLVCKH